MRKIIFTMLLASSTVLFAKSEEPKLKIDLSKDKKILIEKKNIKNEKVKIQLVKKEGMNLEGCLAIAFTITPVNPPAGTAMIGYCLETYSK